MFSALAREVAILIGCFRMTFVDLVPCYSTMVGSYVSLWSTIANVFILCS